MSNTGKPNEIRVRQRCALCPIVFNTYIRDALNKVREKVKIIVKVDRYADGTANLEEDHKTVVKTTDEFMGEEYNFRIITAKTKVINRQRRNHHETSNSQ